jgi:hypothetical protein
MDWANSDHKPTPRAAPAAPTLLEECWRVVGPSKKPITCGIYVDGGPGVELRAGYAPDDLVRSQRAANVFDARDLAEEWKRAARAKGFRELS